MRRPWRDAAGALLVSHRPRRADREARARRGSDPLHRGAASRTLSSTGRRSWRCARRCHLKRMCEPIASAARPASQPAGSAAGKATRRRPEAQVADFRRAEETASAGTPEPAFEAHGPDDPRAARGARRPRHRDRLRARYAEIMARIHERDLDEATLARWVARAEPLDPDTWFTADAVLTACARPTSASRRSAPSCWADDRKSLSSSRDNRCTRLSLSRADVQFGSPPRRN